MGQVSVPPSAPTLILTALDRLVASNADGGLAAGASHVILLGESAGRNMAALSYVYVAGASSLAGGLATVAQNGSVVYGGLILSALTNAIAPGNADGPITAVGYNIAPALVNRAGGSQFIGDNILANYPAAGLDVSANVYIGSEIMRNNRDLNANHGATVGGFNVIIGWRAARMQAMATVGAGTSITSSVIIGAEIGVNGGFDSAGPGTTVSTSVLIGRGVAAPIVSANAAAFASTVAIGNQCISGMISGQTNVFIGSGIGAPTQTSLDNVYLGANISGVTDNGSTGNILLGASIVLQGPRDRCILIGTRANSANNIPNDDTFLVETYDNANVRTLLFGRMNNVSPAGLIVGHSTEATNRDIPGFNILKLINGTYNGTPPVGGGFAYSLGGSLHWVDTNGTDNAIAGAAVISPAALGAGNNVDYAPAGFSTAATIRATVNGAGSTITGIAAGSSGRRVTIFNIAGAANLTLTNEDATSVAANRLLTPNAAALLIRPQGSAVLWYDSASVRWRVEAQAA